MEMESSKETTMEKHKIPRRSNSVNLFSFIFVCCLLIGVIPLMK